MIDDKTLRESQRDSIISARRAPERPPEAVSEVLAGLPFHLALEDVLAHISARPDIDPDQLETFGNACNRLAWMEARGRS
jgi:hypothetical protein